MGHKLIFNGFNSEDYGIIISGGGTYATPERDVTSISVPGRNGDIHIDNGRYNNIQVTYEAGIAKGFESKFLPFMNALLSAPLYSRLEDDYHPELFRLATFHAEMVPEVGTILRSGKFNLTFDCKPQRFLKSGELETAAYVGTATPATQYDIDDFTSNAKSNVIPAAAALAGYTASDLTTMKFALWSFAANTFTTGDLVEIVVGSDEPFFLAIFDQDPTSSNYFSSSTSASNTFKVPNGATALYIVMQYDFNMRLYVNGELSAADSSMTSTKLVNPTRFQAKPLLRFAMKGTSFDNFIGGINGSGIAYDSSTSVPQSVNVLTIDTETMNAYSLPEDNSAGEYLNLNKYVKFTTESIVIEPGENEVLTNANTDGLKIVPNWWVL